MNKTQRIIFRIALILVGLLIALAVVIESRILMIESQFLIGHFFILFFALVLIAAGLAFLFITRSKEGERDFYFRRDDFLKGGKS